jgi:hypothetical protein
LPNVVSGVASVQPAGPNGRFLEAIFGAGWLDCHVTGFPGDPSKGGWWGGRRARDQKRLEDTGWNQYVSVAQFGDDPRGRTSRSDGLFRGMFALCVDDVGTVVDPALLMAKMPGPPTARVQTSPGNWQWWYRFDRVETDLGRARAIAKVMLDNGLTTDGKDPGMTGAGRYGRMPSGANGKPKYGGWSVVLDELDGSRVYSPDDLVRGWGGTLPPPGSVVPTLAPMLDPAVADMDPVLAAMDRAGMVRAPTPNQWGYEVVCPCIDEHTGGADNGCAYRPGPAGGWHCFHGHCQTFSFGMDAAGKAVTGKRPYWSFWRGLQEALVASGEPPMWEREFGSVVDLDLGVVGPRERFLSEYVFLTPEDGFWSLRARQVVSRRALNSVHGDELAPVLEYEDAKGRVRRRSVDEWYFGLPERRVVDGTSYWPGQEEVFAQGGLVLANRYRPVELADPGRRIATREVKPWLDLVKHVLGCEGGRAVCRFLDWAGAVTSEPDLKPGWMIVVQGEQGIGKDMLMFPIAEAVGEENRAAIKGDMLTSGFTGYAERRLVLVSELRQTTRGAASGHDQYNTLKWLVDTSAATLPINPKYGRPYVARNTAAVYVSTNEMDAVALEPGDRRALVFVSDAVKWAPDRYRGLRLWLDELGGWELVACWLRQRWARIGANRRASVVGNAPQTAGRQKMLAAGGGPVFAWVREGVEGDECPEWPSIITAQVVVENVTRALSGGRLPRHLRAPSVDTVGRWLAQLGAVRLNGGQPVRTKAWGRARLWAIRNQAALGPLGHGALARLADEQSGGDFNGSQVVNFPVAERNEGD